MPACAFFGTVRQQTITIEMYETMYKVFKQLINKKGVRLFYSTALSDFDFACEEVIVTLKKFYPDVELVKVARKDDRQPICETHYDGIIRFENNNNKKRCIHTSLLAEYILIDSHAPVDDLFIDLAIANYNRINDIFFGDLQGIMEKFEKNKKA